MKAYTDIEQSKKLADILPIESADMARFTGKNRDVYPRDNVIMTNYILAKKEFSICGEIPIEPCWSLAALLNYIKDKCNYFELVYPSSIIDSRTNKVENVYRLSTDMYDVYEKEAIDACVEIIIKLNKQKLL